jgi:hypothetical protein
MISDRAELEELNSPSTIVTKVKLTVLFLILGGFFFLFTCLILAGDGNVWWRFPASSFLEICWLFWGLGILFVWWRPPLLRAMYLFAERRMVSLARLLVWAAVLLFVVTVALVGGLLYAGILPLKPG